MLFRAWPVHSISSMLAWWYVPLIETWRQGLVESYDIKASQGYTIHVSKNKQIFLSMGESDEVQPGQDSGVTMSTSNSTLSDTFLASSSRTLS